jgi:asparagine synthase (glutamine-hydrolysing)
MCRRIAHRGPDSEGFFFDDGVGLGVRRLSIIDLKTGDQPIHNEDESVWIVFNGEIYNYQELRRRLEGLGHRFYTASDTETVVHAYEQYGEDCPKVLRGMFAFAIWDREKKQLLLARDRVGKKPLLYAALGGELIFGSEFTALIEHPAVSRDVDYEAIHHYLTFSCVPAPLTAFTAIRKLEPGHVLVWRNGEIKTSRYWEPDYSKKRAISEAEAAEQLLDILREAVRLRMISDVPLGAFLSGGLDSSTVVALMSQLSTQPVKTFSIGFEEEDYSELKHARRIATLFETDHREFVVKPEALEILPTLVEHYGEPYADSSAIPTYYLSKLTREHVTVALNGDGGDECFAGYERYLAMQWAERLPGFLWKPTHMAVTAVRRLMVDPPSQRRALDRAERFARAADRPAVERYLQWISAIDAELKRELYTEEFLNLTAAQPSEAFVERWLSDSSEVSLVDALVKTDTMTYLPNDLLVKVDIASMANSLEARSPLLDHELIEFAASLPADLKLHGRTLKYIFKRAVKALLPEATLVRRKQGFGVPIGRWLRQEMRGCLHEVLLSDRAARRGLFKPDAVKRLVALHLDGREDLSHQLWTLLMLELWFRAFVD